MTLDVTVLENGRDVSGPICLEGCGDVLVISDGRGKKFLRLQLRENKLAVFVSTEPAERSPRWNLGKWLRSLDPQQPAPATAGAPEKASE